MKLDGVGPVDMWHVTPDSWHMTCEMWHMVGGEHSLQISASQLLRFGIESVLKILNERITDWMNKLLTKVILEQPRVHRIC